MPEKVTVKISASSAHPDVLTIEDAMRQVLDFFELLAGGDTAVEWRLSSATTNSPFFVEAEAVSFEPTVDITVVARAQKQVTADGLREIADGHIPDAWDDKRLKIAKRIYERNLNGIGTTDVDFQQNGKITVTPRFAQTAVAVIAKAPKIDLYEFPRIKGEVGSIEGVFAHLSTYRNRPAIGVVESRTKSIVWCVLSEDLQAKFADKADFEDFWQHHRVIVRGRIRYGSNRAITQVLAEDIGHIDPKAVPLTAIRDAEFTSGLSTSEYLDRFREGALG